MKFVKNIILSSLLLSGLLVAWPGQGVYAQEGEGVRLLAPTPDQEDLIMLQILGIDTSFGRFAYIDTSSNDNNRLIVSIKNPTEVVNIGLSLRALSNGNFSTSPAAASYFFLIRDVSPGAGRNVVHGPFKIENNDQNVNTWEQARNGVYRTDIELPLYRDNGADLPNNLISDDAMGTPYLFAPGKAGTYSIEFIGSDANLNNPQPFYIRYWDFTVVDNDTVRTGRLWSRNWKFRTPPRVENLETDCEWERPFGGDFYSYTTDSLVTRVDFGNTEMRGLSFSVAFNSTGPGPTNGDLLERRRSVQIGNATRNAAEHQIFLSSPDTDLFPREASECPTVAIREEALSCVEGLFCLPITVSAPGQVELSWVRAGGNEIPIGLADFPRSVFPVGGGPLDTCVAITAVDSIAGDVSSLSLRITYSRGAQHWSAYDVEFLEKGFCVTTELPESCSDITGFESGNGRLYWDDSNITLEPGGNGLKISSLNGDTCDTDRRSWNNFDLNATDCDDVIDAETVGYGDKSTLNTWWYAYRQELNVIEVPIPTVAIIGPDTICTEADVVYRVDVSGFDELETLTYSWTGPDGVTGSADTIVAPNSGEYCVTVANERSCERSVCKTLVLGEGVAPDVSVPASTVAVCPGEDVVLSLINNDPGQPISIEWSPATAFVNNTLAMPDYLEEQGEQALTVRITSLESGCDTLIMVNVRIPPAVELEAEVIFDDVCTPVDTLRATVSDGAIVEWIDADGNVVETGLQLVTNTGPGETTFTARARSTNPACLDTVFSAPLTVRYEPVDITVTGPTEPVCPGEAVILSVTNDDSPRDTLTYVWTPAGAFVDNTLATPDYLESMGGQTVSVTATNQFGCVEVSDTITITIVDPVELEAEVTFDDVCTPVDTLRATVSDGAIVEWIDADGNVVETGLVLVTNTGPGETTFTARARSTNPACLDTVFSAPLTVRYEPVDITVTGPTEPVCPGEAVILSVTNDDSPRDTLTYVWTPAGAFVDNTLATPDYLESMGGQTVSVTATNQFGCVEVSDTITITIVDPVELEAEVIFDDVCTPIDTLRATVSDGAIVEWIDADGNVVQTGLVLVTNTGPGETTFTARARSTNPACLDTVFSAPLTVRYEPVDITVTGPTEPVCPGEAVILSVTNEDSPRDTLTYVWTPAGAFVDNTLATPDYLESMGGQTVSVTATNQFGCVEVSDTITITIVDPVELEAEVIFDDVCTPIDTLRATVSDGAIVEWIDADGNVVQTGLVLVTNTGPGETTFTARARSTNPACLDTVFSAPLTVRYEPVDITVTGPTEPVCPGEAVILSVTNDDSPRDTLTYVWSPAGAFVDNTLATPDYLESMGGQTVSVTATNQFGCVEVSDTITITIVDPVELEAEVTFDDVCTPVDTLRATVSDGAIVEWIDADGNVVQTGLVLVTNTGPGETTFTARARSTNPACLDTVFSAPLTVRYEPVDITVTGPTEPVCPGEEVILSVTNDDSPRDTLTYVWSPAGAFVDNTLATPDYLESMGGQTVSVTATNQFGCVEVSDTITITIVDPVELEAEVTFDDVCTPIDTLRATVSDGAIVEWIDADGNVVQTGLVLVTNTGPGETTFTARARSTNPACLDTVFSAPLTVRYEPVDITVTGPTEPVCPGEEVILSVTNDDSPRDTLTYVWSPAGAFVDNTLATPDYLESMGGQTVSVTATNQFGCVDSSDITITIVDPVELEAEVTFDDVCTPIDTLRATVSDGAIVEWIDADGNVVQTGLVLVTNTGPGETTFTARARSTNPACLDTVFSAPLTVRYEPVDITVTGPTEPVCPGEEVILSVTNDDSPRDTLTYVWSPAGAFVDNTLATPDYLESMGGQTVSVTATNQFGCVDSSSITITIVDPVELEAEVTFDDVCTPVDTLRATVSDGAIVEWIDADGNVVQTGLVLVTNTGPGETTFTARARSTNPACLDTVFSEPLTVRYEPVDITVTGPTEPVCPGEAVILSVTNDDSPRDTLTYVWTPAGAFVDNTLATPDYLESMGGQTVSVTATNQFGCVDSSSITITIVDPVELEAEVTFDDVCTPVDTLRATVSDGAVVEWIDADGNVVQTGLQFVTNTGPGETTYVARARSTNPACLDTVFAEPLTVRYEPVDIRVVPMDSTYCPGEDVVLEVINDGGPRDTLTYVWTPADAFVDNTLAMPDYLEGTGSQTVTVTATNQFGCVDSRSATITILDSITLEATVVFDDVCTPVDTLRATVTGDATVEWLDADGNVVGTGLELITNTGEGQTTFTARATNEACELVVVSEPLTVRFEPVDISVDQECVGSNLELSAINNDPNDVLTYVWTPADAFVDNSLAMPDYLEERGIQPVTVTAINEFECSASATVTTIECAVCTPDGVFLPNFFSPNGDNSNEFIRLRSKFIDELLEVELMIYNRWGEEVFRTTDKSAQWDGTFRGEQLAPDVYGYWLQYRCPGETVFTQKGNITLMR